VPEARWQRLPPMIWHVVCRRDGHRAILKFDIKNAFNCVLRRGRFAVRRKLLAAWTCPGRTLSALRCLRLTRRCGEHTVLMLEDGSPAKEKPLAGINAPLPGQGKRRFQPRRPSAKSHAERRNRSTRERRFRSAGWLLRLAGRSHTSRFWLFLLKFFRRRIFPKILIRRPRSFPYQ
jgi:hypothetical protein